MTYSKRHYLEREMLDSKHQPAVELKEVLNMLHMQAYLCIVYPVSCYLAIVDRSICLAISPYGLAAFLQVTIKIDLID